MTDLQVGSADVDPNQVNEASAMQLPRYQLTVRRLMILVGVIGLVFGGVMSLLRRKERIERMDRMTMWEMRADQHRNLERATLVKVVEDGVQIGGPERARLDAVRKAYHAAMRRKYEKAAAEAVEWGEVPSDPPNPFPYSDWPRREVYIEYDRDQ